MRGMIIIEIENRLETVLENIQLHRVGSLCLSEWNYYLPSSPRFAEQSDPALRSDGQLRRNNATTDTWTGNGRSPPTSIRRLSCAWAARCPSARTRSRMCSVRIAPLSAGGSAGHDHRRGGQDPRTLGTRFPWFRSTEDPWWESREFGDDLNFGSSHVFGTQFWW